MAKSYIDGVLVDSEDSVPPTMTIQQQIAALESQVTPRRYREAILGSDNGWLANMEAQIVALRAQL